MILLANDAGILWVLNELVKQNLISLRANSINRLALWVSQFYHEDGFEIFVPGIGSGS